MEETDEETIARLEREQREISDGVFQLMSSWAAIESALTVIVAASFAEANVATRRCDQDDLPLASAILFSLAGLETRISATQSCFRVLATRMQQHELVSKVAERVFSKLRKKTPARNKAMHGQLTNISTPHGLHARLIPPTFDYLHLDVSDNSKRGLDGNDLQLAAQALQKYEDALRDIAQLIHSWKLRDWAVYEQTLRRLDAQFSPTSTIPTGATS